MGLLWWGLLGGLSLSGPAAAAPAARWPALARQFTASGPAIRRAAIAALRALPEAELRADLVTALATDQRFLALDVISTLKLRAVLDELLARAEQDDSGFFYHAANALISPETRSHVVEIYHRRVLAPETAPAARMALLDALGRLEIRLPPTELSALLRHPYPEVGDSALGYLRFFLLQREADDYLPLLRAAIQTGPYQLRVRALSIRKELPPRERERTESWRVDCAGATRTELREACQ